MPRNPYWTTANVATTLSTSSWATPDGNLTFSLDQTATNYDGFGSIGGQFTSGEVIDYITVNLTVGNSYTFVGTGTYQISISIYDSQGYLLLFTDGDDIGLYDKYPTDSIVTFRPDYTGEHRLAIYYSNVTTTGTYAIGGLIDYGANGRNDGILTAQSIEVAVSSILRGATNASVANLVSDYNAGKITYSAAVTGIVNAADATTSVASMSYQFFTGKIPSAIGFDFLVSPTGPNASNLNSDAYTKFNVVNRFINFAANLGKYSEAKDSFAAKYGSMTLAEATKDAYAIIFGATPTDAKVQTLLEGRVDFLASFTGDTATGIGTKAAMVGFLLAAAATENVGVMARSNDAWLTDLADGSAPYAVNILAPSSGYYKTDFIYGG